MKRWQSIDMLIQECPWHLIQHLIHPTSSIQRYREPECIQESPHLRRTSFQRRHPLMTSSRIDLDIDESLGAEHALEIGAQWLRHRERRLFELGEFRYATRLEVCLLELRGVGLRVGHPLANFCEKVRPRDGGIVTPMR